MFNQITLLCRPGFEKECAGEIIELSNKLDHPAYIQTKDQSGYVALISVAATSALETQTCELITKIRFRPLIFARQWFATSKDIIELPESNRLPGIINIIDEFKLALPDFSLVDVEMDYPDTNDGKSLSKFCKQFKPHVITALKKQNLLSTHANWKLHLFFTDSQHVSIGLSPVNNAATSSMGIPRLKMPSAAPSRSTLKLDEAINWFLSEKQQSQLFTAGTTAVDLGAAPGGWSWQLVQRGCLVAAIDNGPMDEQLMKTGMIEHLKTDAFTYIPGKKVDWLVCDMVERPLHVSRLIARWFTSKQCSHAIFNLKLPMKKRLLSVQECITLLHQKLSQAGIQHSIRTKHLYHDREEVTVFISTSATTIKK